MAGRAGRYLNDGTFGLTGEAKPFDDETVRRLENHDFEPVRIMQWRNRDLSFASLEALKASLNEVPAASRICPRSQRCRHAGTGAGE